MTDDLVEKVAFALCKAAGDDPDREGPWAEWWQESAYALDARAIIPIVASHFAGVARTYAKQAWGQTEEESAALAIATAIEKAGGG